MDLSRKSKPSTLSDMDMDLESPRGQQSGKLSSTGPMEQAVSSRRSSRISGTKISEEEMQRNFALIDKFDRGDRKGGVGIPGGRKAEDVEKFRPLQWGHRMAGELATITRASERARSMDDISDKRELAEQYNRKIEFQKGQIGHFSLHVGNDIAGVWNSPKRGSKVYDYENLTESFSRRFTREDKSYFTSKMDPVARQSLVATGMQLQLAGRGEDANVFFQKAGATEKGQKWINKFSTLMLSERARELSAGIEDSTRGLTHAALDKIVSGKAGFSDVFSPKSKQVASFVGQGGAESHREHALTLKKHK